MPSIPALFLTLAYGCLLQAQAISEKPLNGSATTLLKAELAFAKQSDTENTRAAFLSVLDEDGVLFRPGPVNGKAWFTPHKADASNLTWYPAFIEVSRSGDLGYSTGPYVWRSEAGSKEVPHGHFVSIWGWKDGAWKLLLDTGVAHGAPHGEIPLFKPQSTTRFIKSPSAAGTFKEALAQQERAFAQASKKHGLAAAYRHFASRDLRFYRNDAFPMTNSRDALRVLEPYNGAMTWTCLKTRISKSGDLGYSYGFAEQAGIDPTARPVHPRKNAFLHVWKRAQVGGWKLVLDIESPLPPE